MPVANPEPLSEADPLAHLVAGSARGDRAAFASLYQATSRKLFGLAMRTTRQRETAEEVLQEAYLAIWSSAGRYDPGRAPVFAWMATIVRRRAIDRMRAERVRVRSAGSVDVEELAAADTSTSANELLGGTGRRVDACLKALEGQRRSVILMAYYNGLSHSELSERLGVPLGTVKSWIRRGLQELRECIGA